MMFLVIRFKTSNVYSYDIRNMNTKNIIVVGDIHGDMNQFLYPLFYFCEHKDKFRKLIYLGDYIDRGENSCYIFEFIRFIMKNVKTNDIIFLRGNHESYTTAVRDYIKPSGGSRCMATFVFDGFKTLPMDIVHHDEPLNILFSHSAISIPLKEALKYNKTKMDMTANAINTYTSQPEHSGMEYRNIHGHVHFRSRVDEIRDFVFRNKKMISIDGDASYGIRLVERYYNLGSPNVKRTVLNSKVCFLVIGRDNFTLQEHSIQYNTTEDLNTKPFAELRNMFVNRCKCIAEGMDMSKLNLQASKSLLMSSFDGKPMTIETVRDMYNLKHVKSIDGVDVVEYLHDVPFELWQSIGLLVNYTYEPTGWVYWKYIIQDNNKALKLYDNTSSAPFTGGVKSSLYGDGEAHQSRLLERMICSKNSNEVNKAIKIFAVIASTLTIAILISVVAFSIMSNCQRRVLRMFKPQRL